MTDLSILQRIAAGEASAVNECVAAYSGLIWSLARRYLRNEADAEDAVQEIFVELWTSADRYDPGIAKESTFISTITRRRLIDRVRRKGRGPQTESIDDQVGDQQPSVRADAEDSAEIEVVDRVLDQMESQHRQIISMSLYEGYSHSEIAEQLDMPLGTVKTKVRRGLIFIREQLELTDDGPSELKS